MRKLRVASVPEVGLFWLYSGKVYKVSEKISDLFWDSGTKAVSTFHVSEWGKVKERIALDFPSFDKTLSYKDVPRGRIWLEEKGRMFVLVSSNSIVCHSRVVSAVLSEFNIPESANVQVNSDSLYEKNF